MRQVVTSDVPAVPWRNGGGLTRELLAWPSPQDWHCRLSVADIASDGPFSAFPGVARHFVVLEGDGVALDFAGHEVEQRPGDAPRVFDGASAPGCRLLGGPVRDLNLMSRGGSGGMAAVLPGAAWQAPVGALAGLFARAPGRWRNGTEELTLPALGLLWFDTPPPGDWRFEPDAPATPEAPVGWWLHHIPEGITP